MLTCTFGEKKKTVVLGNVSRMIHARGISLNVKQVLHVAKNKVFVHIIMYTHNIIRDECNNME